MVKKKKKVITKGDVEPSTICEKEPKDAMVPWIDKQAKSITPELSNVLFQLYSSGLTLAQIYSILKTQGYLISWRQIKTCYEKQEWPKRKREMIKIAKQFNDDQLQITKIKKIQASSIAVEAMSEYIIKEYMEYKANPEKFLKDVAIHARKKPIWIPDSAHDAKTLLEMHQFVLDEGVQKHNLEGKIDSSSVLSGKDRKSLLSILSQSKQASAQIMEAEIIVDGKDLKMVSTKEDDEDEIDFVDEGVLLDD